MALHFDICAIYVQCTLYTIQCRNCTFIIVYQNTCNIIFVHITFSLSEWVGSESMLEGLAKVENTRRDMKSLDINLTKDSSLLLMLCTVSTSGGFCRKPYFSLVLKIQTKNPRSKKMSRQNSKRGKRGKNICTRQNLES
jgi:hypothetical protein